MKWTSREVGVPYNTFCLDPVCIDQRVDISYSWLQNQVMIFYCFTLNARASSRSNGDYMVALASRSWNFFLPSQGIAARRASRQLLFTSVLVSSNILNRKIFESSNCIAGNWSCWYCCAPDDCSHRRAHAHLFVCHTAAAHTRSGTDRHLSATLESRRQFL